MPINSVSTIIKNNNNKKISFLFLRVACRGDTISYWTPRLPSDPS